MSQLADMRERVLELAHPLWGAPSGPVGAPEEEKVPQNYDAWEQISAEFLTRKVHMSHQSWIQAAGH